MNPEAGSEKHPPRWPYAILSLVLPLLLFREAQLVRTVAVPELRVDALERGLVREVRSGGGAEAAGLRAGDVIRTVNGVPFSSYDVVPQSTRVAPGTEARLSIERAGRVWAVTVPFVSVVEVAFPELVASIAIATIFWGTSTLLLWRRFYRVDVRLLFLFAQAVAAGVLFPPLAFVNWWHSVEPLWLLSTVSIGLSAPLLLHYHLLFPVPLGSRRQRSFVLGVAYGAIVLTAALYAGIALEWLPGPVTVIRLAVTCFAVEMAAAVVVALHSYARSTDAEDRRRLRIIVAGIVLALIATTVVYVGPAAARGVSLTPEWLVRLFLAIPLFAYVLAAARYGLFGIDHLLNRALVYGLLSLAIFALYLGPLVLVDRLVGDALLPRTVVVTGISLLVGLSFSWTRTRVQRWADSLFYGGWYDYPAVVESVSDALAGSLKRGHLKAVLNHQVPEAMHLKQASLWIGEPEHCPPQDSPALQRRIPLRFRGRVRGIWTVGPRADGDPFSRADGRILDTLGREAEIALSNVLLVEALENRLEEIRASREMQARTQRRLLHSREEERARLARELHDGPTQALVGLKLELGLLADAESATRDEITRTLADARREVQDLLSATRRICAELRPPILDTLGLGAAVDALAQDWSTQCGVSVKVEVGSDVPFDSLDDSVAVNLYRIVQEALANVARHAAAQWASISVNQTDGTVMVSVEDDGQGFVVPDGFGDLAAQGHFGLAGIDERVDLIGGSWSLASQPGEGTTLRVVAPSDPPVIS